MSAWTETSVAPETVDGTPATVVPYAAVGPYSKLTLVETFFAFTTPFNLADEGVRAVPPLVVATGALLSVNVIPM
jgi:hypothetical protein